MLPTCHVTHGPVAQASASSASGQVAVNKVCVPPPLHSLFTNPFPVLNIAQAAIAANRAALYGLEGTVLENKTRA